MSNEDIKQDDRIKALEDGQKEIMKLLQPISDTYRTINMLGKWGGAFLVLLATIFTIIASWGKVIKILFKH